MMFLAHFSSTPIVDILEMELNDIYFWFNESLKIHEKLNPPIEQ